MRGSNEGCYGGTPPWKDYVDERHNIGDYPRNFGNIGHKLPDLSVIIISLKHFVLEVVLQLSLKLLAIKSLSRSSLELLVGPVLLLSQIHTGIPVLLIEHLGAIFLAN